jgi:hypothetical protein
MASFILPFVRKTYRFISASVITTVFLMSSAAGADVCVDFRPGGAMVTKESQVLLASLLKEIADHPTPGGDQFQIEVYYADDLDWPGIELASDRARSLVRELLGRNGGSPTPWVQILLRAHDAADFATTHCPTAIICTRGDQACGP